MFRPLLGGISWLFATIFGVTNRRGDRSLKIWQKLYKYWRTINPRSCLGSAEKKLVCKWDTLPKTNRTFSYLLFVHLALFGGRTLSFFVGGEQHPSSRPRSRYCLSQSSFWPNPFPQKGEIFFATHHFLVSWFFTNPSEKYAQVKLGPSPQGSGWK